MKNICILFLSALLLISCVDETSISSNQVIVSGKVSDYEQVENHNMMTLFVPDMFTEKNVEYQIIKDDGSFKFAFELNQPIDIELEYFGRTRFYVSPGDSLFIDIDGKCWTKVINNTQDLHDLYKVSGKGSELAEEVKNYNVFFEDSINEAYHISDSIVRNLGPLDYSAYMNQKLKEDIAKLNNYLSSQPNSKQLVDWVKTDITQNNYWLRMRYIWRHPMKTGQDMKQFVSELPESYFSFLEEANLSSSDFKTGWFGGLMHELDVKTTLSIPQEVEDSLYFGDVIISEQIKFDIENYQSQYDGFFKDILIAKRYYRELENHEFNNLDGVYDPNLIADKNVKAQLETKYNEELKLYEQLQAEDNSHLHILNSGSDFINDIVTKYQGKAIYIDFWAPWCGPCMTEMEYAKGMKKSLKDKDVVFVYVGWQCTEESWKATITEKGIKGEHYILEEEDLVELNKRLDINSIPRYILINTDGEMIYSNAPHPSDNQVLLDAIDEALNI
ncbi:TlpA family protein disulfide reductase [Carboxylicivirga linearis]|uniref:TlpA family protein disulfide reductase n=1 Tax=Carboxylicivirga linearis TaxID=1628157 RepID=A0ABS5JUX2_9BACT|nr:TlpA disulfide reductase family protein [Carboxylicivirga linearis]MBS2098667.1 TlpA family protein disulfide reductase [Carboxylicivirga linearis]